jgi:hypothetical protein
MPSVAKTPSLGMAVPGIQSKKMVRAVQVMGIILQVQSFLTRRIIIGREDN